MKAFLFASLSLAAIAVMHPHQAKAASFDCSMANLPSEITICANPKLSDLDTVLSAAFNQIIRQNPGLEYEIRQFAQRKNLTSEMPVDLIPVVLLAYKLALSSFTRRTEQQFHGLLGPKINIF